MQCCKFFNSVIPIATGTDSDKKRNMSNHIFHIIVFYRILFTIITYLKPAPKAHLKFCWAQL